MIVTFVNGTDQQKQITRHVLDLLLHYPIDTMPLTEWRIEFVADPDEGGVHNEFAVTKTEVLGSGLSVTRMRDDAPDFGARSGEAWGGVLFYQETVIHELGHAIYANLPEGRRLAIARMFGLNSDDPLALEDPKVPWKDRFAEAIAETFKDAFLPPSDRRYYSRATHKIPLAAYPHFRSLFRLQGATGFAYKYGGPLYRMDLSKFGLVALPYHQSPHDPEAFVFYEEAPGYEHGWGVDMSQFKDDSGKYPFSIELEEEVIG